MSSCDRRRLLRRGLASAALLPPVLMGGCNLRPLYGGYEGQAVTDELAAIAVTFDKTELAQTLAVALDKELNPRGAMVEPAYELILEVEGRQTSLAIQLDSTITRYDLYLLASFALRPMGSTGSIYSSAVRRVASYNVVRQPYATLAARRDAERRAAIELARDIRTKLALYFAERPA